MSEPVYLSVRGVRAWWAPHPIRHPVQRWRTRHVRRALRRPLPPIEREVKAQIERSFLFGDEGGDGA